MVNHHHSSQETNQSTSLDDKNLMSIAQYLKDAQQSHKRSIPPLDQWHPKHCGKMDLIIKANGEWWHEGQLIKRQALLDLFSKVLWKEDAKYYLKTPVEQIDVIEIDCKSFIQLTTTNQDIVIVDEEHPIFMRAYVSEVGEEELRPYVHVRFGLNALIQRAAFYHLIELGVLTENSDGEAVLELKSGDLLLQLSS